MKYRGYEIEQGDPYTSQWYAIDPDADYDYDGIEGPHGGYFQCSGMPPHSGRILQEVKDEIEGTGGEGGRGGDYSAAGVAPRGQVIDMLLIAQDAAMDRHGELDVPYYKGVAGARDQAPAVGAKRGGLNASKMFAKNRNVLDIRHPRLDRPIPRSGDDLAV